MARYILSGMLGQKPVRYELKPGTQTLGRSSACDIVLSDPAVSKQHAEIILDNGRITVRDLGSRNGTFVNEVPVSDPVPVKSGDNVRMGHLALRVKDQEHSTISRLVPEKSAAPAMSTSIDEARTLMGVSRSDVLIGAVHEAGQMLSKRYSPDELYDTLLDLLSRFFRSDRILLLAGELKDGDPEVLASRATGSDPDAPIKMSRKMLSEVLESRRSFLTKDASADERFNMQQSIISAGIHSALAAPLFDNDNILGVVYMDSRNPLVTYASDDLQLVTLLANMMAVKITNSRLEQAEEERARIVHELELATKIQKNLLPSSLPAVPGYEIFGFQAPCHEVGGDLYDMRLGQGSLVWLALGDVTGKGIGAAMLMASAMAGLQILEEDIVEPLLLVNRLHGHVRRHVEVGQFITLFTGTLEPSTGEIHYVNAGQNPPMVLRPDGTYRELDSTGVPVALLDEWEWDDRKTRLEPGETLLIFSDGVTETIDTTGTQYDEGRFDEFLKDKGTLSPEDLGHQLLEDIRTFRGAAPIADDLTLLIIRRL